MCTLNGKSISLCEYVLYKTKSEWHLALAELSVHLVFPPLYASILTRLDFVSEYYVYVKQLGTPRML